LLSLEEFGEQGFPLLDWLAAQIATIKLKQIERAKDRTRERTVTTNQIKDRKAILVANDCLPIDQARANG
jgi:hypothetical protein